MSANIHYEVFVKKHRKAGWNLVLASEDRTQAIDSAKQARGAVEECSVRVSKESYDETNEVFHSVSIFTQGPDLHQRKMRENNRVDPPCSSPDQLYTLHARRTLGRALSPWLKRNNISVIELLHRPDMAEKLAAAGFDRQHAIQKVAIVQAGAQECSVQHVVRCLTELADKATNRLRKMDKKRSLPGFQKQGYAATYQATKKHAEPEFALRHALAQALIPMQKWPDKFAFLSGCMSDALVEGEGCAASIYMLDEFISETAALPHALDALVNEKTLGKRLDQVTNTLIGEPSNDASSAAKMLAKAITSKRLPKTQSVLAARVFRELCGPRRLFPDDFDEEVLLNRTLAARLTRVDQSLAPVDQLAEAFTIRSARLLENEAIQTMLATCNGNAAEEIHQLLQFEESIVGTQNKTKLSSYLRAVIGGHKTRTWFAKDKEKPLARIAQIARSQRAVMSAGFSKSDKAELSTLLDRLCADVLQDTGVLDAMERRKAPSIEIAFSLMKLCDGGLVTLGSCSDDICNRVLKHLRAPQVKIALQTGDKSATNSARDIQQMIERVRANS
ncbi:hypothetical protein MNBD_ALPHA06-895 [hydrothermal vent metagenome]|uniref:Uncharacterized protein n=1 Tax=hydrothermal vent metagenome TaxID=652676 RepID=A0A3B0RCR8_9ZZZZ